MIMAQKSFWEYDFMGKWIHSVFYLKITIFIADYLKNMGKMCNLGLKIKKIDLFTKISCKCLAN